MTGVLLTRSERSQKATELVVHGQNDDGHPLGAADAVANHVTVIEPGRATHVGREVFYGVLVVEVFAEARQRLGVEGETERFEGGDGGLGIGHVPVDGPLRGICVGAQPRPGRDRFRSWTAQVLG